MRYYALFPSLVRKIGIFGLLSLILWNYPGFIGSFSKHDVLLFVFPLFKQIFDQDIKLFTRPVSLIPLAFFEQSCCVRWQCISIISTSGPCVETKPVYCVSPNIVIWLATQYGKHSSSSPTSSRFLSVHVMSPNTEAISCFFSMIATVHECHSIMFCFDTRFIGCICHWTMFLKIVRQQDYGLLKAKPERKRL